MYHPITRNTAPSLHQLSDRLINVIEDELKVCIKSKVLIVNYAQALVNCLIIIAWLFQTLLII